MDWLKDFLRPELIWFLVGLLLLLAEFAIPGLIVLFFGIGAWIVAVTCLVAAPSLNVQLGIFIGSSVLSLVLLRSWLTGIFLGHVKGNRAQAARQGGTARHQLDRRGGHGDSGGSRRGNRSQRQPNA